MIKRNSKGQFVKGSESYWTGKKLSSLHCEKLRNSHLRHIPWNKGKKGLWEHTEEWKKKMKEIAKNKGFGLWMKGKTSCNKGKKRPQFAGEKNQNWKGDDVGYVGLHNWVNRYLGKPTTCEHCGKNFTGHRIGWANKSGEYKRDLNDWLRLCGKCHRQYDIKSNLPPHK